MRIFLFDMDGTLLHLNLSPQSLSMLREKMFSLIERTLGDPGTKSIFGMYAKAVVSPSVSEELVSELRAMIDEVECCERGDVIVNRKLMSYVAALRRTDVKTGLVTSNGRKVVKDLVEGQILQINDFDAVVTRDDVSNIKPSPAPLEKALYLLGATKKDVVWFIGDSRADEQSVVAYNIIGTPPIHFEHVNTFTLPALH